MTQLISIESFILQDRVFNPIISSHFIILYSKYNVLRSFEIYHFSPCYDQSDKFQKNHLRSLFYLTLWQDLVILLEAMRIIAVVITPVTPSLSWRIYEQLGYSEDQFNNTTWVIFCFLLSHMPAQNIHMHRGGFRYSFTTVLFYFIFFNIFPMGFDKIHFYFQNALLRSKTVLWSRLID